MACHYGDSEEQVEESMRIASSAVYNKLMLFVLVSEAVGGGGWQNTGGTAAGQRSESYQMPLFPCLHPLLTTYCHIRP